MKLRERIKQQSKEVAEYMAKPKKYNVTWTCPKCGNCHNWWWEDEFEAHDDGASIMTCDRCGARTWCQGDGNGFYEPIEEERKAQFRRDLTEVNSSIDQLVTSRRVQFSLLQKLISRMDDFEDAVDVRFLGIDEEIEELREAINSPVKSHSQPSEEKKEEPIRNVLDIINAAKPPFHARLREGCQFTKEELPPDKLASILRFIAVEVERMTERDMGGSFTISNLKVAQQLRDLAVDASAEDYIYDPDLKDEEGPGWGSVRLGER